MIDSGFKGSRSITTCLCCDQSSNRSFCPVGTGAEPMFPNFSHPPHTASTSISTIGEWFSTFIRPGSLHRTKSHLQLRHRFCSCGLWSADQREFQSTFVFNFLTPIWSSTVSLCDCHECHLWQDALWNSNLKSHLQSEIFVAERTTQIQSRLVNAGSKSRRSHDQNQRGKVMLNRSV